MGSQPQILPFIPDISSVGPESFHVDLILEVGAWETYDLARLQGENRVVVSRHPEFARQICNTLAFPQFVAHLLEPHFSLLSVVAHCRCVWLSINQFHSSFSQSQLPRCAILCGRFGCRVLVRNNLSNFQDGPGRREKTPTPKTRFSIWTLLRTPGRFTTRPLPVYFAKKVSVVRPFSVLSKDEIGPESKTGRFLSKAEILGPLYMGKTGSICRFPRALPASIWGHCSQILVFY